MKSRKAGITAGNIPYQVPLVCLVQLLFTVHYCCVHCVKQNQRESERTCFGEMLKVRERELS